MTYLPVHVNWPLLVAFLAHQQNRRQLAMRAGVTETSVTWYLNGRVSTVRFNTGVRLLTLSKNLKTYELWQCIGMHHLPQLPESVDWAAVKKQIKSTYKHGEIIGTMSTVERECYATSFRAHRQSKPLWPNGALLLNIAQDRLSAAEYMALTHTKNNITRKK